ncbi:MAG: carbohydrate deacetylase [Vicinamibacterales bacterium]
MTPSVRVVVNADDLGISEHVNAEIFRLIRAGRVTSATLVANGAAVEDAAARLHEFPDASFGVHLNITEFAPLTSPAGLGPLLKPDGTFSGGAHGIAFTSQLRQAVRAEWTAQIARLRSLGVDVSHIDSHNHAHTIRGLFGTLKAVQRATGIRRVRLTKNLYTAADRPGAWLLLQKSLWNAGLRHYIRTRTTAAFTSFWTLHTTASADVPPARSIEVMVHPGHPGFADENAALEQEWWRRFRYGVEFVSYRQI